MGILAPTYFELMAGAIYPSGAVLSPAQVEEWQNNHRIARLRALMNWRGFGWVTTSTGSEKRVWYCPGSVGDNTNRPNWVSYRTNAASPQEFVNHRDWQADNFTVSATANVDIANGMFGVATGTRRGLWSLRNSGNAGYYPTGTVAPVTGALTRPAAFTSGATAFSAAYPGGTYSRMLTMGTGGALWLSVDDGDNWTSCAVAPNPNWRMGAASYTEWVFIGTTQIYRTATVATPTAIAASNATIGIGTGVGIVYDSARSCYWAWGTTGLAKSIDGGVTFTLDAAAPMSGADVRAFGVSDDGIAVAAVVSALSGHLDLWGSNDGGSNWMLLTRAYATFTAFAGCGRIEYGAGRFVLPTDDTILVSERVAF